ncbi:MAG: hypothetical protein LBJ11_03975 [Oscillospiraceae bacterium]|jgi:hypothetical protein|nr:hypothetical protein [Oscillospiraceae bacterium]
MALQNYVPQKNLLLGMGNSLADLNSYAGALRQFTQELNVCWAGNADKAAVFQAIDAQMRDVNSLRQNVNWVQQAANWALEKINELGSLLGLTLPWIGAVGTVSVPGAALHQRMQLDTAQLRQAADKLNAHRGQLGGCQDTVCQVRRSLDAVLQGVFGIGGKLQNSANGAGAALTRHDRLVAAVWRIADIYDTADGRVRRRAEEIVGGGGTVSVSPASAGTALASAASAVPRPRSFIDWLGDGATNFLRFLDQSGQGGNLLTLGKYGIVGLLDKKIPWLGKAIDAGELVSKIFTKDGGPDAWDYGSFAWGVTNGEIKSKSAASGNLLGYLGGVISDEFRVGINSYLENKDTTDYSFNGIVSTLGYGVTHPGELAEALLDGFVEAIGCWLPW